MKHFIRAIIKALSLEHTINDSPIYRAYVRAFLPGVAAARRTEANFYSSLPSLKDKSIVFDIGANRGDKAAIFLGLARTVVCVEPSPRSAAVLRARFGRNRKVVIVENGVGSEPGTATFNEYAQHAYNTFSAKWSDHVSAFAGGHSVREVAITTLDALIAAHGMPGYIKIDVEGWELQVLKGLSQPVPLLGFECNLSEMTDETVEAIRHIAQVDPSATFNYCVSEPPVALVRPDWVSAATMIGIVEGGAHDFMEIYARAPVAP